MVTMGPVCVMKLTRKQKFIRTLGFVLNFFPQFISCTGSWDRLPVHILTLVTMGPVCLMKLTSKWKFVRTLGFFLDFFPQLISTTGSWDRLPVHLVTMVTMGTVCLMKLTRINWPEHKHYECELTESDFLPSISSEKFRVVPWDYSFSSAPSLTELRAGAELDNKSLIS